MKQGKSVITTSTKKKAENENRRAYFVWIKQRKVIFLKSNKFWSIQYFCVFHSHKIFGASYICLNCQNNETANTIGFSHESLNMPTQKVQTTVSCLPITKSFPPSNFNNHNGSSAGNGTMEHHLE